jgi:hypothetical protein
MNTTDFRSLKGLAPTARVQVPVAGYHQTFRAEMTGTNFITSASGIA